MISSSQVSVLMRIIMPGDRASALTLDSTVTHKQLKKQLQVKHQNFGPGARPVTALNEGCATLFTICTTKSAKTMSNSRITQTLPHSFKEIHFLFEVGYNKTNWMTSHGVFVRQKSNYHIEASHMGI